MHSKIFPLLFSLLFFFFLFETGSCLLAKKGLIPRDLPNYSLKQVRSTFWVEIDPVVGTWHAPHSSYRHRRSCFDVEYRANSFGMRDREQTLTSDKPRSVILGDSFVEGYGMEEEKRISNMLEKIRGRETLNFGTSGFFGPTEYYLLYQHLAKKFSHDEVIVGIYPNNDFTDDDYDYLKKDGRYKPFFVGTYPDYKIVYTADRPRGLQGSFLRSLKGFFREYTYSYSSVAYLIRLYRFKTERIMNTPKGEIFSGFYDFTPEAWDRTRYALEKLVEEAGGKKVAVFLIPSITDLKRYGRQGRSPLSAKMEEFARTHPVTLIDLLPYLHDFSKDWEKYYDVPCDHHFSEYGSEVVARYIQSKLGQ